MKESLQFLNKYCSFDEPDWVWILTSIIRNKDNANIKGALNRKIIREQNDIEQCYVYLKSLADNIDATYRMYISLNARSCKKTAFSFQHKLLDLNYDLARDIQGANSQIKKIDSLWKTELAQSQNRATKRFLLDIDNESNLEKVNILTDELNKITKIYTVRKTVSGYVVAFDACDTRNVINIAKDNNIEMAVQKDSMVFVEQFMLTTL